MSTTNKTNTNRAIAAVHTAETVRIVLEGQGIDPVAALEASDDVGMAILRGEPGVRELVQAARSKGLFQS